MRRSLSDEDDGDAGRLWLWRSWLGRERRAEEVGEAEGLVEGRLAMVGAVYAFVGASQIEPASKLRMLART